MAHNITIVAHRGKGPTQSFTDPGNLWSECQKEGLLVDPFNYSLINNQCGIVPEKIMIQHNKLLISDVIPPENTIASFERAIVEGAEIIELDVFISKDGIPVVIHDKALNRNVSGAPKNAKISELGYIGTTKDYNVQELQLLNMGNGNKIPTLQEVVDLLYEHNTMLDKQYKPHLKLNIELKDKDSVEPVVNVIRSNIESGKINNSDIIYCCFKHDRLERIVTLDREANIAFQFNTKSLYGKKNVNSGPGWIVDLDKKVTNHAICTMKNKINKINSIANHQNNSAVAIDTVLWDVDPKLIKFVKQEGLDLYLVGAFRDFSNIDFAYNLLEISKDVRVFFKTDEPAKAKEILNQLSSNSSNLDSSSVVIDTTEKKDFVNKDNYKYLQRLPKPKQKVLFIEESTPNDLFKIIAQHSLTLYNHNRAKIAAIDIDTLKVIIYDRDQFFSFLNQKEKNSQEFINEFRKNRFEIIEIENKKSDSKQAKILYNKFNSLEKKLIINESVKALIKKNIALWKKLTEDELKLINQDINTINVLHKKELIDIIKKHVVGNMNLQNESINNNTLNLVTKKICGKLYKSTESGFKIHHIYKKELEKKFKGYVSDQLKEQGLIVDKEIINSVNRKAFKCIVNNDLNINIKSLIEPKKKYETNLYKKLLTVKINKLIDKNVVAEKAKNKLHKIYDNNKTEKVLKVLAEQSNTKAISELDLIKQNVNSNTKLYDQQYKILKKLQNSKDYTQLSQKYGGIKNTQELITRSLEKLEKKIATNYKEISALDQVTESLKSMEIIDQVVKLYDEGGNNYSYIENQNDSMVKHAECGFLGELPQEVVC